jgi:tRNA dimethylallyltransferase
MKNPINNPINNPLKPIVVVLGYNAIGKSRLALKIAERFNGEIISADSRQVYKYLDIGTAKVTLAERNLIPHYLIDVAEPNEIFSLASYQNLAFKEIDHIHSRGKLPVIAGGTGLYISAIVDNLGIPACPPDEELRNQLEEKDILLLVKMLSEYDPISAQDQNLIRNRRRLIRALECCIKTNSPFSQLKKKNPPRYEALLIGLTLPFEKLFPLIDARVDRRFDEGMIAEVEKLRSMGISDERLTSLGLEYRCINRYILGEIKTETELRNLLKTEIHQFTRRQKTWFKKDQRINWITADADLEKNAFGNIERFLVGSQFLQELS